jgi:hypothetical protein
VLRGHVAARSYRNEESSGLAARVCVSQFVQSDAIDMDMDVLDEIRFYIPKGEDENPEDEDGPEVVHRQIMEVGGLIVL